MRRALTLAGAAAVTVAGCGGDSGGGKGRTVTVAAGKSVGVSATEYSFDPKTIVVQSSGRSAAPVRFELRNDGATAHDLRVERGGQDLGGTSVFGPGQTQSGTARLSPGTYEFLCTVGDHAALGMKGTLVVRPKSG